MMKFYGTLEYLLSQRAAIVTLTDEQGGFAGAGRIVLKHRAFEPSGELRARLYEAGYSDASFRASSKGGRLEVFKEV